MSEVYNRVRSGFRVSEKMKVSIMSAVDVCESGRRACLIDSREMDRLDVIGGCRTEYDRLDGDFHRC